MALICHPSKVMLRVILNRLVNQSEQILEEEQVGFRSQRSTTEQIFNMGLLVEKHLDLYHKFIDFKKAFDGVLHEGLWRFLKELVLKTLQFLNYCRSRINRIKQQKLALPISLTLDSYNGQIE